MSSLRPAPGGAGELRDRSAPAGPGWPARGVRPVEQFRSTSARSLAVVWWALSLFSLVDLAAGARDHLAVVIVAGVLLSDALVWVGAWRPGVVLYPEHVVLRGSVRDRVLPLAEVTDAWSVGPLKIVAGGRTFTSAAVSSTLRERRRAGRETAAVPHGLAGRAGRGQVHEPGRVRFSGVAGPGGMGGMGGMGGLGGGGRSGPTRPGFDDSRMNAATREAVAGRTPGSHAAERIAEEARRLRRAERAAAPAPVRDPAGAAVTAVSDPTAVSAVRWLPVPLVLVAVLLAGFVAVASS